MGDEVRSRYFLARQSLQQLSRSHSDNHSNSFQVAVRVARQPVRIVVNSHMPTFRSDWLPGLQPSEFVNPAIPFRTDSLCLGPASLLIRRGGEAYASGNVSLKWLFGSRIIRLRV
jgi:hypothetical protein